MKKYVCTVCGYIYDPAEGDPDNGVAPGTAFEDVPDDWLCPTCGVGKEDFEAVLDEMRLANGLPWPIPIVLDVDEQTAKTIKAGDQIALRDTEGFMPAVLTVSDIWKADKLLEAESIYDTQSTLHPGVDYLLNHNNLYKLMLVKKIWER